jgi:ankyrin repeat protein
VAAALREGDINELRGLLRAGLNPHWGWVCETMRAGHIAVAEMLLESGVEQNVFTMAAMGDADGLDRRLSRRGTEACLAGNMEPASEGVTPLHVGCASDWKSHGQGHMTKQLRIAEILKQYGSGVNTPALYRGIDHATPLFCACWTSRNIVLVRWLIDNGAVPNGGDLMAALGHLQRHGREAYDIAEFLLSLDQPVEGSVRGGRTPLQAFANQGTYRTVEWLIAHGADVNARGPGGWTAAHFAAKRNTGPKTLAVLVEAGADLSARDDDGHTPLDIARLNEKVRVVEWIKWRILGNGS